MKNLSIQKIDDKNINYRFYKRRIDAIKKMNEKIVFPVKDSFYAIYVDESFVAAGNFSFDKETSELNISLLNGSNTIDYNYIMEEATKRLTDIANETYGLAKVKAM